VFAGLEDNPAKLLFSFSDVTILFKPDNPPKVKLIHSIDDANLFENCEDPEKSILKINIVTIENPKSGVIISFDLISVSRSFHNIARMG
jgi:hypothetical protein